MDGSSRGAVAQFSRSGEEGRASAAGASVVAKRTAAISVQRNVHAERPSRHSAAGHDQGGQGGRHLSGRKPHLGADWVLPAGGQSSSGTGNLQPVCRAANGPASAGDYHV